jgi:hypothetical protein
VPTPPGTILAVVAMATASACSTSTPDVAPSCAEVQSEVQDLLTAAEQAQANPGACTSDSDCTVAPDDPTCSGVCGGGLVNPSTAAALDAAVARGNALCAQAPDCPITVPPCPETLLFGQIACVSGSCITFPATVWQSFSFDEQSTVALFAHPCTAGACTQWTVTPDARIVVARGGQTTVEMLSAADFATVDGIMRDVDFRRLDTPGGGQCVPYGEDEVSFVAERDEVTLPAYDVTGCVLPGAADDAGSSGADAGVSRGQVLMQQLFARISVH